MVMKSLIIAMIITFLVIIGAIVFICVDDARSKKEDKNGKEK